MVHSQQIEFNNKILTEENDKVMIFNDCRQIYTDQLDADFLIKTSKGNHIMVIKKLQQLNIVEYREGQGHYLNKCVFFIIDQV